MDSKRINVVQKHENHDPCTLQKILDGLPNGIAVFNQQLLLSRWNNRLVTLLDLDKAFLASKTSFIDILQVCEENRANTQKNLFADKITKELKKANISDKLFPFSYEYYLNNEKTLEIKGEILPDTGLVMTIDDISLRVNPNYYLQSTPEPATDQLAEVQFDYDLMLQEASKAVQLAEDLSITREISENNARHIEAILNAISDVLVTMDDTATILTCNQAAMDMFGYEADEVIGRNLLFLITTTHTSSESDMGDIVAEWVNNKKFKKQTGCGTKKNGSEFPVELCIQNVIISGEKQYTMVISDLTERREAETIIRRMALHDNLTGLANRNLLHQRLDEAMAMATRQKKKVSVMFLDLDGFKPVNDMHGHATGDKLLKIVAERLEDCARDIDTVARLGGDEFAIITTNINNELDVTNSARRILRNVKEPIVIDGHSHQIGTSIGISFFPHDSSDPEELIRMADVALYQAKNDGKDVYRLFDPDMDARAKEEKQIEVDLTKAINNDELALHYQPLLDAVDYNIIGAEALIRWFHPEKGLIPPVAFIPIAENSDLMLKLGQKILNMACRQAKKWQQSDLPFFKTSVNISVRQFQSKYFVRDVKNALEDSKLDPNRLELEITEGMVIDDTDEVTRKLTILTELGVSLAIDDFGTGYSSLAYLKRFPVHQLKIDRSFIEDIIEDHDDAAITDAVIRLGHSLGLTIVAEGVETRAQVEILRQKGCDVLQGYYFSKPVPADQFDQWLINHMKGLES